MRSSLRLSNSRFIVWVATIQLATAALSYWAWFSTGNAVWLRHFFDYQGAVYFLLLDVFKLWLCIVAWMQFRKREPLGSAWLTISLAMSLQLAGDILDHWLCVNTYINPLHYIWPTWKPDTTATLQVWGTAIAGPLFMGTLAVGLMMGLRHYRKVNMLGRLRPLDLLLIGAVGIYALYVIHSVFRVAMSNPSLIRTNWILTWPNDVLLAILLFEAILLARTVLDMGQGYIARTWGAFAVAIFLTSLESFAHWMTLHGYFPYPQNSVMWSVWFIWAAAFAMGPAYQVDAIRLAKSRANDCGLPAVH